jgi:hypothetical protein
MHVIRSVNGVIAVNGGACAQALKRRPRTLLFILAARPSRLGRALNHDEAMALQVHGWLACIADYQQSSA